MTFSPVLRYLDRLLILGERLGGIALILSAASTLLDVIARVRRNAQARAEGPSDPEEEGFEADEFF